MQRHEFTSDKKSDIVRLMELTGVMGDMLESAQRFVDNLRKNTRLEGAASRLFEKAMQTTMDKFKESLNSEEIRTMVIRAYEQSLTASDVKRLIEFYESDLSKFVSEKSRELNKNLLDVGNVWIQRNQAELDKDLDAAFKEEEAAMEAEMVNKLKARTPRTTANTMDYGFE